MTARKSKALGTEIEVSPGAEVRRPDGSDIVVTGGIYVLDVPGIHVIEGHDQPAHEGPDDSPTPTD